MGGLECHRWRLLLLCHPFYHWLWRPGPAAYVPGSRTAISRVLSLFITRAGAGGHDFYRGREPTDVEVPEGGGASETDKALGGYQEAALP